MDDFLIVGNEAMFEVRGGKGVWRHPRGGWGPWVWRTSCQGRHTAYYTRLWKDDILLVANFAAAVRDSRIFNSVRPYETCTLTIHKAASSSRRRHRASGGLGYIFSPPKAVVDAPVNTTSDSCFSHSTRIMNTLQGTPRYMSHAEYKLCLPLHTIFVASQSTY